MKGKKKAPQIRIKAQPVQSKAAWDDTPDLIREQGFVSQKDLYRNLGLSRQGLYYVLKQAEERGFNLRRATVGKKLFFHLADVMAALFPNAKEK